MLPAPHTEYDDEFSLIGYTVNKIAVAKNAVSCERRLLQYSCGGGYTYAECD